MQFYYNLIQNNNEVVVFFSNIFNIHSAARKGTERRNITLFPKKENSFTQLCVTTHQYDHVCHYMRVVTKTYSFT